MGRYKVLSRNSKEVVVEATTATTTHSLLDEMAFDDVIPRWAADSAAGQNVSTQITVGETLTVRMTSPSLPSQQRDERKEKHMARRLMDTLVKQYAPDADTAWDWMRKAHEMGWEWANHVLGGPTSSDPLGQRVNKSVATAFSNGAGGYVGICLVGGAVRWGWFRDHEWGPRGRDMVLSGDRSHHETPIAAMAEFALLGESAPKGGAPLEDVFGVVGMTELTHKSERKECERELKVMPGRWRVAYKNDRYEFRLSIVPGRHYFVIQYRSTKPKGWVIFEAKVDEKGARSPSGHPWCARRKVNDVSYPSPGAAAVAGIVANLFPVGS